MSDKNNTPPAPTPKATPAPKPQPKQATPRVHTQPQQKVVNQPHRVSYDPNGNRYIRTLPQK